MEETIDSIYEKINAKRALLGISEKDFTKPKRKTNLKAYREIIISSTGWVIYK